MTVANLKATNMSLYEKQESNKKEIDELYKKFNIEFQNITNKIFEEKTIRFNEVSSEKLGSILQPLNLSIESFRKKVEEV